MKEFDLGRLLRGTTYYIKKFINSELNEHELSEGQFEYFVMIYKHQGINQKDLGDLIHTGKAAVTKAVKRLLDEELIYRKVNTDDHRHYGLYITAKGQNHISIFHDISSKLRSSVFANFTDEEKEILFKLMQKMYENAERL